jgi:hypothetical protein
VLFRLVILPDPSPTCVFLSDRAFEQDSARGAVSQPSCPEDARRNAERQAVEFGVEIGEYHGVVGVPQRVFQRLLPDFLGLIVGLLSGTDGVGTSPAKAAGLKPAPVDRGCSFADRRRVGEIGGGQCEAGHLGALLTVAVYITPFLIEVAAKIWIRRKGVDLSDVQAEGDPNRKRRPRFLLGIWRDEGRE